MLDYVNLGCGQTYHPEWVNVDMSPADRSIIRHDLLHPLSFADGSFSVVYHSHVLEHLPRAAARPFLDECWRLLKRGGVIRIAIPDLETISRLYLRYLDGAVAGEPEAVARHEWMTLELLDQLVREETGGEMMKYWRRRPMPAEDFVVERLGAQVRQFIDDDNARPHRSLPRARTAPGENHRWMYDRVSLGRLLADSGFDSVAVLGASRSSIPDFERFRLDVDEQGRVRKPDSLFMEAFRP
jgi:predicted SAM-dependent methyltransferase